jgi:hypothetical protein
MHSHEFILIAVLQWDFFIVVHPPEKKRQKNYLFTSLLICLSAAFAVVELFMHENIHR